VIQVIGFGGEPATGKTHLMRSILAELSPPELLRKRHWKLGLLVGSEHTKQKVHVLGDYRDPVHPYNGTDRLSMAVSPAAVTWLLWLNRTALFNGWTVLLEGDRLFNGKLMVSLERALAETTWILLTASEGMKLARRGGREDTKPEGFLKGRRTKLANLAKDFKLRTLVHHEPEDTRAITTMVVDRIRDFSPDSGAVRV
jgi:hypothetical protein